MKQSQVILGWQREAKREVARELLLEVLRVRLQEELPVDITDAINGSTDLEALHRWFSAALTTPSLDDFRAAMSR